MLDARILDFEEAAFVETTVDAFIADDAEAIKAAAHLRSCFRWHRMFVFNWLMMNGVAIPADLLSDDLHSPIERACDGSK